MKNKFIIPIILISFFFFRCSNAPKETESEQLPISTETTGEDGIVNSMESDTAISTLQVETTQPQVSTEVALNPAHGEPGHRCDIAVGAPLNSAPSQPASQEIKMENIKPIEMTVPAPGNTDPQAPASVMTAPGMNPPHGEPGHDCAIPVGQPLKK